MKKITISALGILLLLFATSACSLMEQTAQNDNETDTAQETEITRPEGWTEESHSKYADPNYDVVFPQDQVNQITITIEPDDWEAMQANMVELAGEPGNGRQGPGGFNELPAGNNGPPAGDFEPPDDFDRPEDFQPPAGRGQGFGGPDGSSLLSENPMWVPATIEFAGQTWNNVGVRYKGNSSLNSTWNSGSLKMPLKLDFDEFEDEYPEINDQRFYGFKQLSLANGFGDDTFMRDTITYDLLEEAGLPAAETAYYEVFLDYGEGPVSLGLYTAIEVIDDTVVERVFGDDDGNIYEGDGNAASFAEGTFNQIEESFQKENNEDEADWSDIEKLYNLLHSDERTTNPDAWRENIEAIFDVDNFLEWLALSAVIQHWDTYGNMSHNYYLYNNPETGKLTWISWDHNLVLGGSGGFGGRPGEQGGPGGLGGRSNTVSLDKTNVGEGWPLIRYLLDDPNYYDQYVAYVADAAELFDPEVMMAKYESLATLIQSYAAEDVGEATFETAVNELITITNERAEAVAEFLNN